MFFSPHTPSATIHINLYVFQQHPTTYIVVFVTFQQTKKILYMFYCFLFFLLLSLTLPAHLFCYDVSAAVVAAVWLVLLLFLDAVMGLRVECGNKFVTWNSQFDSRARRKSGSTHTHIVRYAFVQFFEWIYLVFRVFYLKIWIFYWNLIIFNEKSI